MRGPGQRDVHELWKHHPVLVVLRPEVGDRRLMSPYLRKQRSFGDPLIVKGEIDSVAKDQLQGRHRRRPRHDEAEVQEPTTALIGTPPPHPHCHAARVVCPLRSVTYEADDAGVKKLRAGCAVVMKMPVCATFDTPDDEAWAVSGPCPPCSPVPATAAAMSLTNLCTRRAPVS